MLVDTNIFIDFLKGSASAKKFIEQEKSLSISVLSVMEIVTGLSKKSQIAQFEIFLEAAQIKILYVNELISLKGYSIFIQSHHRINLSIPDSLIAATAITYQEDLITLNTKHFLKIEDLTVVKPY